MWREKQIESKQFVYTLIKEQSSAAQRNCSYIKRWEEKEKEEEVEKEEESTNR